MTHLEAERLRAELLNRWGIELEKEEDRAGFTLVRASDRLFAVFVNRHTIDSLGGHGPDAQVALLAGYFFGAEFMFTQMKA